MKVVIAISTDYLEALYDESIKYSFNLQGYGSFELANKDLMYTNVADILGFVYLGDNLPTSKREKRAMFEFFNNCELLNSGRKFLLAVQENYDFSQLKLTRYKYLKFKGISNIEFITDTFINASIYGSILLDNYKPYLLKDERPEIMNYDYCPVLKLTNLISKDLFSVLEPIHLMDTLKDTFDNDAIISKYSHNALIVMYRELCILKKLNLPLTKQIQNIEDAIKDSDGELFGIYSAFLQLIVGGF